ncbi:MAG: PspC domain-containing protein [Spirosomataceae bacterium]
MKKTISINIAGLIFYIEEDGYDKLRNYLNSIQKYFSTYEDSKEIISDIEGRIAEKFLNKQKNAEKQVIALEDVEELIKSMGTVADFEAIEEEEDLLTEAATFQTEASTSPNPEKQQPSEGESARFSSSQAPKKLVRDTKRKLLGGVCAGIAHYFNTDPLITRLLFLFFFLGVPTFGGMVGAEEVFGPISGFIFLLYIACWVAFPGSDILEEDKNLKKFYRDPDQKVVGGVASGVAAYFGVDIGVVRFVWVLSILLFGTGLMLYIILWLITPKANTLTEKMEMVGQPITLENIETNVKKALQPEIQQENILTKLLLFPFRLVAMLFSGLAPLMKFLVVVLRIFAGFILMMIGGSALIGLLVALFSLLGLGAANIDWIDADFWPAQFFLGEIPSGAYFFFFFAIAIPFAAIAWIGISLLSKENKFTPAVWQTMLGLFLLGVIGSTVIGTQFGSNFRKTGKVEETRTFDIPQNTLLLGINDNDDRNYENLYLDLEGQEENKVNVAIEYRAQGRSRDDAEANARMITYNIAQKDSLLVFDEHMVLKDKAKFRGQKVRLMLSIPFDKPFAMSRDFYHHFWIRGRMNDREYALEDDDKRFETIRWAMKKDSGLVCLNRALVEHHNNDNGQETDFGRISDDIESGIDEAFGESFDQKGDYVKQFEVGNFHKINIGGAFLVRIQQGEAFKVVADGREEEVDDLEVSVENDVLRVQNNRKIKRFNNNQRVGLTITLPSVETIDLAGATLAKVTGFNKVGDLKVGIAGASKTLIDIEAQKLNLNVSGASKVELRGSTNNLDADLAGACTLDAEQMRVQNADVSASGVSKANLGNIPNLRSNTSGFSKIRRQGREDE